MIIAEEELLVKSPLRGAGGAKTRYNTRDLSVYLSNHMRNYFSYPWAVLYGLYFYVIFQGIYFWRFGSINIDVNLLDLYVIIVGIVSVFMLMYTAKRLSSGRGSLFVAFLIAIPFAYIGALGGGLLGATGILLFGLIPFGIALGIAYWLLKDSTNAPATP